MKTEQEIVEAFEAYKWAVGSGYAKMMSPNVSKRMIDALMVLEWLTNDEIVPGKSLELNPMVNDLEVITRVRPVLSDILEGKQPDPDQRREVVEFLIAGLEKRGVEVPPEFRDVLFRGKS